MQKTLFIFGVTVVSVAAQSVVAQVLGTWFVPNFLILAVIFFNLYRGLRCSLAAAFLGGVLLDGLSGTTGGVNVFSLVMCAFATAGLKKYIYQPGVESSRVLMTIAVTTVNTLIQYFLLTGRSDIGFGEAFRAAIFPEILWTTVFASFTFERFKQCASRSFV